MATPDKPYQVELRLRNRASGEVVAAFVAKLQISDEGAWATFDELAKRLATLRGAEVSEEVSDWDDS